MLVKVFGSAVFGVNATIVTAEVNVFERGQGFILVGLPDAAVRESYHRMDTTAKNNGYYFPRGKRVVINLAPADVHKEGTAYDLPMAVGLIAACGHAPPDLLADHMVMGELSLDGGVRPIKGVLPIAVEAKKQGFKGVIVPKENAREAGIVSGLVVYGVDHIQQVIGLMRGEQAVEPTVIDIEREFADSCVNHLVDIADVKGQENINFRAGGQAATSRFEELYRGNERIFPARSTVWPANCTGRIRCSASARTVHRTTRSATSHWSEVGSTRSLGRSAWRTTACSSSMSCRSSSARSWR